MTSIGLKKGESVTEVWNVTFNVPASAAAGTLVQGTISRVVGQPSTSTVNPPITELWAVTDFYTTSTVTPDAQIQLVVNNTVQPTQPDLNSCLISNQNKFKIPIGQEILIEPSSPVYINAYLLAANGSTAQTYTLYVVVIRKSIA